ncbi:sensor histidine kinase [Pricia sp. S334]|uniref:histidine kinase n=1 Tax=Pricia mediterranea TaxID=3076079 RepID=A0ABU3LAP1_9FLAO|nr:sensor histidine kinase [Pricia sp. S334]MDT7830458.1 sensor histidine kinase [Pricia sp. S334]
MKFKLTTARLIVLSLILLIAAIAFIWTSITYRIEIYSQNAVALEIEKSNNRLNQAEVRLTALYQISKKNVQFLANLIALNHENDFSVSLAQRQFSDFLKVDDNYFQGRFLNASGNEVIRVERIGGAVFTLRPKDLQYKGDRYYFKEASQLSKGKVFVSNLDLNVEDGEIERPYRPTLRFFSPVVVNGEQKGVVGLNLNVENWFQYFNDTRIGILNSKNEVYFDEKGDLYKKFEEDLSATDSQGHPNFYSKKVDLENNLQWTLFTRANNTAIDAKLQKFRNEAYRTGAALIVGLLFLITIVHVLHVKNRNISKLNRAVENRLHERDTLIKEIHHRVKNNLQVVSSLLSLQSSFIKDDKIKMLFRYSQYRINSMGMVHEMLYKSDNLNRIDYGAYIEKLVQVLITSMKGDKNKIKLVMDVENIYLNIDTSIPLGLLINEITTNSLKYGFSDGEKGVLSVKLIKIGSIQYKLFIGDNGSGIPPNINFRNTKSLGLKLIHKLALQLRGNIEKDNSKKGTNYIITFNEIEQTS